MHKLKCCPPHPNLPSQCTFSLTLGSPAACSFPSPQQPEEKRRRLRRQRRRQVRLGETIYKGHRSYDLMLNLQLGIRYTITTLNKLKPPPRMTGEHYLEKVSAMLCMLCLGGGVGKVRRHCKASKGLGGRVCTAGLLV